MSTKRRPSRSLPSAPLPTPSSRATRSCCISSAEANSNTLPSIWSEDVPLIFSFWFMVAAYVVHVIDESLLGGSFVEKVQQHWWPQYSWTKFFWFNTGYFLVMILSVVLYDLLGGDWV